MKTDRSNLQRIGSVHLDKESVRRLTYLSTLTGMPMDKTVVDLLTQLLDDPEFWDSVLDKTGLAIH